MAMTAEQAIANVQAAFSKATRPALFIRGTCSCCECMEHNATLAAHDPDTISLKELGNPGWDPICFASDQAFAYYLPAMIRLAFGPDYYLDQLLFHLNIPERVTVLDKQQAAALLEALWALEELKGDKITEYFDRGYMEQAIQRLEAVTAG